VQAGYLIVSDVVDLLFVAVVEATRWGVAVVFAKGKIYEWRCVCDQCVVLVQARTGDAEGLRLTKTTTLPSNSVVRV
jgi:ABC-type uncharacterized transport system ATPase subunit